LPFPPAAATTGSSPGTGSKNFPDSFAPNHYSAAGRLLVEADIKAPVIDGLRQRGHDVEVVPAMPAVSGFVCAIIRDSASASFGQHATNELYVLHPLLPRPRQHETC